MNGIKFAELEESKTTVEKFLQMTFGESLNLRQDEIQVVNASIKVMRDQASLLASIHESAAERFAEQEAAGTKGDYERPYQRYAKTALATGVQAAERRLK